MMSSQIVTKAKALCVLSMHYFFYFLHAYGRRACFVSFFISFASHPTNVVLLTLPKTGTNLVLKLLQKSLDQKAFKHISSGIAEPGIYWAHDWQADPDNPATIEPDISKITALQQHNTKLIILFRDPRQHIIALLRVLKRPLNAKHITWAIKNFPEALAKQTGQKCFLQYANLDACYRNYLQWCQSYDQTYITYFEKLVGPQGGGTFDAQLQETANILSFLGTLASPQEVQRIASELFGGTPSFKKGSIDTWRTYFSKENKALFKEVAGQLLIDLGYETDLDW